ncbi:hypothetical protein NIES593_15425 [Hydrococcus rivularis NIES-593]|uniref:Uncharacterized protein n=1 Tax=Hydrococcus rivularis NIES-593 TaxID=1921803 RepID=A0A1U7HDG5_9CYAN|nr:hypothetical protein [Hydrococcus rivularis]OKH21604.1 hypothetical protein NIES593_15425 [Hydrococcus rivularis NIES-593]
MKWSEESQFFVKLRFCTYALPDKGMNSLWQVPLLGFLLALAILFRRHFAYSARAFLVAMFLQGFIIFSNEVRNEPRRALKNLTRYTFLISLIGLSSLATLTLLAPKFLVNILTTNYRFLYASYEKSLAENFQYYGETYGWLFGSLTVLGFSTGTLTRVLLPLKTSFILIFGSISLIQWGLFSRQLGIHYTTHFTWFVALGLTALLWTTGLILKKKARILMLVAVIILLTSNAVMGLTSLGIFDNSIRPFFSASQPPIVRQDYDEIHRLIDYLRQLSPERKPIFVAASSGILNDSLLQVAQEQIYGRKLFRVIDTPDVDSRDYYPLSSLLEAQYVIVATPFQHHLPPEEQDVVKVVVDAFTENWELIRDFQRLPKQFVLDKGVKVSIYERTRLTSAETILQTLHLMQERIQPKPSNQSDWIVFSRNRKKQLSEIGNNLNGTVNIKADFTKAMPTDFLYFVSIPEEVKVTGNVSDLKCSNLSEFSIRLLTLNQQGELINTTENLQVSKAPANFSLSLPGKNAAYLRLDLVSRDRSKTPGSCYININNLTVSKKT